MKKLLTVTLCEEDNGDITVNSEQDLTGEDLDFLIERLSIARMHTRPPVPEEDPLPTAGEPHVEPFLKWAAGSSPEQGHVLAIRHSGLGWVWFRPPAGFANALKDALDQAEHHQPRGH